MKRLFTGTAVAIVMSALSTASDLTYKVTVDTTPLDAQTGYLALDFFQGDPVQGNTATISAFTTDGTLGALTPTGDASGSISPGPGTLDDKNFFFNEFLQAITFGRTVSFTLELGTADPTPATADNLSLYLLDLDQFPIATSDPTGADSLISIDLTGQRLSPNVYTSADAIATIAQVTVPVRVPEPRTFWFAGIPLFGMVCRRLLVT